MYTVTSRSTIIGHARSLGWSPQPDQELFQFLPPTEFRAIQPRIDPMMAAVEADSPEHPYDALPDLLDLDLALRDETGLIVVSGVLSIVEGSDTMAAAAPEALRQLGIEPTHPLLFLLATFGDSLELWEPERHKGKTPAPHAKRREPAKGGPPKTKRSDAKRRPRP